MPSPGFWTWCNALQRSVQDIFKNTESPDDSPYLSAIQSLKEKTPGRKRAELNALIKRTIANIREKNEAVQAAEYHEIPAGFTPLVRVAIGAELQLLEVIIEGLKSEDSRVTRKALSTRWFFDAGKEHVTAHFFTFKVMRNVSLGTRRAIIRNLSRTLIGHEKKAEEFFESFADPYGHELVVPILPACSADFIRQMILEYRIALPVHVLDRLYQRQPDAVVWFLQLANKNNKSNEHERKRMELKINDYEALLPRLIKKQPRLFIELYELTPDKRMELSKAKAFEFLKSSKDVLVDRPALFLKLLPLKVVSKALDKSQFDRMLENLFPRDKDDFNLDEMLNYLTYYEHADKIKVLKDMHKTVYREDLPIVKFLGSSAKLAEMLSAEELGSAAELLLEKQQNNEAQLRVARSYLPPGKLLPTLMSDIKRMSSAADREDAFISMIVCCQVYKSPQSLLEVLEFYKTAHKNERPHVLGEVFQTMRSCKFEGSFFKADHWRVLMEIVRHVNAKDELFSTHVESTEWVLEGALRYYLADEEKNSRVIDEIVRLLLVAKVEHGFPNWSVTKDDADLERKALEKLLKSVPLNYPNDHALWKEADRQVCVALNIVRAIVDYNERNFPMTRRLKKNAEQRKIVEENKFKLESQAWLCSLLEKCLLGPNGNQGFRRRRLWETLEKSFPTFYASRLNDPTDSSKLQDIETGKALALLKRDPRQILDKWDDYLEQAATKLAGGSRAARRFVSATKWHSDIPIKFVERSIDRIRDSGYIIVLGILLEGEAIGKILLSTLELESELDIDTNEIGAKEKISQVKEILQAIKFTNPPILLGLFIRFCSPIFINHAVSTLTSLSYRVPAHRMSEFTRRLADSPRIAVKKQGIRLYAKTTTRDELFKFFKTCVLAEPNASIRLVATKIILKLFRQSPSQEIWELVRSSMTSELTVDTFKALSDTFTDLRGIRSDYLSDYVQNYLDAIESLPVQDLKTRDKVVFVSTIVESLDAKRASFLSKSVVEKILSSYFFHPDSAADLSRVAQRFAVASYLLPATEDVEFENRLKIVLDLVKRIAEQYGQVHESAPRHYPANHSLEQFFKNLVIELEYQNRADRKLRLIDTFLALLDKSLRPHQALRSRVLLSLYREHCLSDSPQDFGDKCSARCRAFVEEFSSEFIVRDFVECLQDVLNAKSRSPSDRFGVIQGLARNRERVGCLMAVEMLQCGMNVGRSVKEYDDLIVALEKVSDFTVKACLDRHLSNLNEELFE